MNEKNFSKITRKLFSDLALNDHNIVLNGSFRNSYFASDIDLYEPVQQEDRHQLVNHIKGLSSRYNVTEIKLFYRNHSRKPKSLFSIPKHALMVKLDILLDKTFAYPIECTIIYDFNSTQMYNKVKVTRELLDDITSHKYSILKKLKRMMSLFRLYKMRDEAEQLYEIVNDSRIGVMNLSKERLELVRSEGAKRYMKDADIKQVEDWVEEDLRRVGVKEKDLDHELDKAIKSKLKHVKL